MVGTLGDAVVGRASYSAYRDAPARVDIEFGNGAVVRFGRGADCAVRFGHAPVSDPRVPRIAGRILVAGGRAMVESPVRSSKAERPALRVTSAGRRPQNLAPGAVYAPPGAMFSVHIAGDHDWVVDVVLRPGSRRVGSTMAGTETLGEPLELSARDLAIISAYAQPILVGGLEPGTHAEVGRAVGLSVSTARRSVDVLLDRFYGAGLRVHDSTDGRLALVHAAIDHGLLDAAETVAS